MGVVTARRQASEAWLQAFAQAVRDRDYAGARDLCHDDVTGFGTVESHYVGIEELQQKQWHRVWGRTEDFEFELDDAAIWADGELVVAISQWSSAGIEDDGLRRRRHGRATIVLTGPDDALRAVHTHFSMAPGFTA